MDTESPVLSRLRENLRSAGIGDGSCLQIHCGIADIQKEDPSIRPMDLTRQLVSMLKNLVGSEGTLLMSTDSVQNPQAFAYNNLVFDADRMPSRRGSITETFRKSEGVIRSRHPWCNASAWGKHAQWLLADHLQSQPFAMDRHSPWYKVTELDADIVYIGVRPHSANLSIVLPQHVLGHEYPIGCFLDKPVPLQTKLGDEEVVSIPVLLDAHDWTKKEVKRFIRHMDRHYQLHRSFGKGATEITLCKASAHFEAIMAELKKGHPYPHMRYWL